jgi:hypothetical protein
MVLVTDSKASKEVDVLAETSAPSREEMPSSKLLTVEVKGGNNQGSGQSDNYIGINYGELDEVLTLRLNRTIRVPDNADTNVLPPSMGLFPLFKVQDYAAKMPEDMARKGGLFFPMYQREAMWVGFSARMPFALKMYVGGVNAVSGFPMRENEKTREKRKKVLEEGKGTVQDYMVVPAQPWLDGIVSEDGKIRQFVAKPKGSGFSVEVQVTGEESVGGIQIEVVPMRREVPEKMEVRYEDHQQKVILRTLVLKEKGLGGESTWGDMKTVLREEFGLKQDATLLLEAYGGDVHRGKGESVLSIEDEKRLDASFFGPDFTLGVSHQRPNPPLSRSRGAFVEKTGSFSLCLTTRSCRFNLLC